MRTMRGRRRKYTDIMARATALGLMEENESVERMMDIESADLKFHLRLDEWLKADDFNFAHDFCGILSNIRRESFPATDFGLFVPRFAGEYQAETGRQRRIWIELANENAPAAGLPTGARNN